MPASVTFAGLSATGLYQLNVVVPDIAAGATSPLDAAVIATVSGMLSQATALLSVAPTPPANQTTTLDIVNFSFVPDPVTVNAAARLTWTNKDGPTHTVTADDNSFLSGRLPTGESFSQMLKTPGTYNYHCSIHPSMHGTIIVK